MVAVEEKLNPDAEPNPEDEAAGLLSFGEAKEKEEACGAAETADEPNPEGGCVGADMTLPKPAEDDGAAEEPNPLAGAAKLKLLGWTGAPNPTRPKMRITTGATANMEMFTWSAFFQKDK